MIEIDITWMYNVENGDSFDEDEHLLCIGTPKWLDFLQLLKP